MPEERNNVLLEVGRKLKAVFPGFFGNIQFNLKPDRRDVNVNVSESLILGDEIPEKTKEASRREFSEFTR